MSRVPLRFGTFVPCVALLLFAGISLVGHTDELSSVDTRAKKFVEAHGPDTLLTRTIIVAPGVRLGVWVGHCRAAYREDRIAPWLADALESVPGWAWNPCADRDRARLAQLKRYVTTPFKKSDPPSVERIRELARWLAERWRSHGEIPWLDTALRKVPGWREEE